MVLVFEMETNALYLKLYDIIQRNHIHATSYLKKNQILICEIYITYICVE